MLDIKFVKSNQEVVKKNLKNRNQLEKINWVDEIIKNYDNSIKIKKELDELRHKRNAISEEINLLKKQGKDISQKIKEIKELPHKIKELEENYEHLQYEIKEKLSNLPNILDNSVPVGKDENDNKIKKVVGKIPKFKFSVKDHTDLALNLNVLDMDKAAKVAGARFYYLKNELVKLNQALINFALDFFRQLSLSYYHFHLFQLELNCPKYLANLIIFLLFHTGDVHNFLQALLFCGVVL